MSAYVNKLGMEIKVGQIWRDCDKRMSGRHVRVLHLSEKNGEPAVVVKACRPNGSPYSTSASLLRVRRMHPHSTGFAFAGEVRS